MLDTKFWKKYFSVYDILNHVGPYRSLLEEIVGAANPKHGDNVLDMGVGTGNLALLLQAKGATVLGIDFSDEALQVYKMKNPSAQVYLHDLMNDLHFLKDESFDIVVSNNVLYNLPRPRRKELMKDVKRVLKPGGQVVLANIHKGFKPVKIYLEAIKENIKKFGFLNTFGLIAKLFVPTLKIFYYNSYIKRAYKFDIDSLFDFDEQKEILQDAGFREISPTKLVYAGQGIINTALK